MDLTEIQSEFTWARSLTIDLLRECSDSDLSFSLGEKGSPLWKQFRHIARVHENYLNALQTGKIEFGFQGCTYNGGRSKQELLQYFDRLDSRYRAEVANVRSDATVDWHGEGASDLPPL